MARVPWPIRARLVQIGVDQLPIRTEFKPKGQQGRRSGSLAATQALSLAAAWFPPDALAALSDSAADPTLPVDSLSFRGAAVISLTLLLVLLLARLPAVRASLLAMVGVVGAGESAIMVILYGVPLSLAEWLPILLDATLMMALLAPLLCGLRQDSLRVLEKQRRVLATLESLPDGVIRTDAQGRIEYLNSSAKMLTGWEDDSALGKTAAEVLQFVGMPSLNTADTAPSHRSAVDILTRRDGTQLFTELSYSFHDSTDADGGRGGAFIAFRDVTLNEQISRDLLISNEHQRLLNHLLRITTANVDLPQLLRHALQAIVTENGIDNLRAAAILLADAAGNWTIPAHYNVDSLRLADYQQTADNSTPLAPGLIRQVEDHYRIPLCHGDLLAGLLVLEFAEAPQFAPPSADFLESVGKTLSHIIERKRSEEQIRQLAYFDPLTRLPNRQLLVRNLDQALGQANFGHNGIGLILLNIDRFKDVNDILGHGRGDLLLIETAQRLQHFAREGDTLARLGSAEFGLILTGLAHAADAAAEQIQAAANRIRAGMELPFHLDGLDHLVTVSMGAALYPADAADAPALLRNADSALNIVKSAGRNGYQRYSAAINTRLAERLQMEKDLRTALGEDQFFLVYQPQVELTSNCVIGVEALLRWRHPTLGLVSPAQFIPLAEEIGLIAKIGEWVLNAACMQMAQWEREAWATPIRHISVNVSPLQIRQPDFAALVRRALAASRIAPGSLELELTETMLMHKTDAVLETLTELKDAGLRFAIDDFGTGYSSLSYLKRFPLDVLKIDQSFVRDISTDVNDSAIVRAIIDMARALNLRVIAEGVETPEQLGFLRLHRCHSCQGYYFSRPIPAEHMEELIARLDATAATGSDTLAP